MSFDWDIFDRSCWSIDSLGSVPSELGSASRSPVEAPLPSPVSGSVTSAVVVSKMQEATSDISGSSGRLAVKSLLVTYSQVDPQWSRETVANHLLALGPVERMVVCQESHQDQGVHFHAMVTYKKRLDLLSGPLAFRIGDRTASVRKANGKGRVGLQESCVRMWNYCLKEDKSPLIRGDPPSVSKKRNRNDSFATAMELAISSGVRAAMEHLAEEEPYELVTRRDAIERGLTAHRLMHVQVEVPARSLNDFDLSTVFFNHDFHSLFVSGPSGTGKTQFARALLPDACVVSHVDQLRTADFSKGVIFDDFSVRKWPAESVIHLCDWEVGRGVHCRYATAFIPAHTRKIFTTNLEFRHWIPEYATPEQVLAIERRIEACIVSVKLFH